MNCLFIYLSISSVNGCRTSVNELRKDSFSLIRSNIMILIVCSSLSCRVHASIHHLAVVCTDYCHATHMCLHHPVSRRFSLANAEDALCHSSACAATLQCVLCECGVCVDVKAVSEGPEVLKVNGWSPVAHRDCRLITIETHTRSQTWIRVAGDSEGEQHTSVIQ